MEGNLVENMHFTSEWFFNRKRAMPRQGKGVLKRLDQDIERDYLAFMPRPSRLDAPGALHDVDFFPSSVIMLSKGLRNK